MESPSLHLALITAGIALAMGVVSLFVGMHKNGEKTDVLFGVMCLSLFFFFFLPPQGFVIIDIAPYSSEIILKRFFNFLFGALFPWFVFHYSNYKEKKLPVLISSLWVLSYIMMAFTKKDSIQPLWVMFVLLPLGMACIHGFISVKHQHKTGDRTNAKWLRVALYVFLVLYLCSSVYQFNIEYFIHLLNAKVFFPINLFPLAFIVIMGIRLRSQSIQRVQLVKTLDAKLTQWESLIQHLQLIAVHLDTDGKLRYINPYGLKLLHFNQPAEIVGKNWVDYFLPGPETNLIKALIEKADAAVHTNTLFQNPVKTKDGEEKNINWTNELIYDLDGKVSGVICLGTDITDQEKAVMQIQQLKMELEKENLQFKMAPATSSEEIVGNSEAVVYAIQKANKVAGTQASVLLEGETGVGKELFADLIQRNSMRRKMPFIKVNCGALPADLIEDELFGHEKGAFTGAIQSRKGRFDLADGGTIFLDEIGELPLDLQAKLLRVLQSGEFERIGSQSTTKTDVRIIAATNRDLGAEVREGRFREDLFYRLNVYPITIPSLRDRKEDLDLLIQLFVDKISRQHGKSFQHISKSDLNRLREYAWPGNIRELKNVIERSIINCDQATLRLDLVIENTFSKSNPATASVSLEEIEKEHILKVLNETNWRISGEDGAAKLLVMNPNTLRSRMKKLNIVRGSGNEVSDF